MQKEIFVAVLAGLGGMLGWGLADFFAKKTIDKVGDVVSLAWGHVFGTIALIITATYKWYESKPISLPSNLNSWFALLAFGVGQAVVYLLVYKGFGKGQVGILSPIFATFSGLTAILSIMILRERIAGFTFFG